MNATKKVIPTYLIIGSGRVARHLRYYLSELQHQFDTLKVSTWDRNQSLTDLDTYIASASHILVAISDSEIEPFYKTHLEPEGDKTIVHFSGALNIKGIIAAHPLMTFGPDLYELDFYKKIHFVITGADTLAEALPGFPNPYSTLFAFEKAKYHAHCVLGGNFSTILIGKMLECFISMGIPEGAARPYIEKVIANTFANPGEAFTGPLARKDIKTVQNNLEALKEDPFQKIYNSFLEVLWPEFPNK